MIYLYSKCFCTIYDGKEFLEILPFVFYEIKNIKNEQLLVLGENCIPFSVNLFEIVNVNKKVKNVEKVNVDCNTFLVLNFSKQTSPHFAQFKCGNLQFSISVSNEINLNINGENVLSQNLDSEIFYSHYEQIGDITVLYFNGERKFVIVTQNTTLKFADYYDEINVDKNERYFMKRQYDSLNHGKVVKIKDRAVETYLAYLDDNPLNMKTEFVFLVFLDCYLAGNFKYCNQLLDEQIKQKDEKKILSFFNEFDNYIPYKNIALTFKKNTLAGVYEFEVENNKITNIIHLK